MGKFKVQATITVTNMTEIEVEAATEADARLEAERILNGPDQPKDLTWDCVTPDAKWAADFVIGESWGKCS